MSWSTHGLERAWFGFVYLNPPFDRYAVGKWIAKLAAHNKGICLLHARTEAAWFEPIWRHAAAILFLADRIKFCRPDGSEQPANSGAHRSSPPSVMKLYCACIDAVLPVHS